MAKAYETRNVNGLYLSCHGCQVLIAPQDVEDRNFSTSRYGPVLLCPDCGTREAFEGDLYTIKRAFTRIDLGLTA